MKKTFFTVLSGALISGAVFLSGCSATSTVPAGDRLFTGSTIKWEGERPGDYKNLHSGLENKLRPEPNRKFLGMPVRLWLYNLGRPPKGKGLNYLLREKWGQGPVLLSLAKTGYTADVLRTFLEDNGYFQAAVGDSLLLQGKKKASSRYTIEPGTRYRLSSVTYEADSNQADREIRQAGSKSLLKPGEFYSLDKIKTERLRIQQMLKEKGYYHFLADHLVVEVDSAPGGKAALYLRLKKEVPASALRPYRMDSVILYPGYSLGSDSMITQAKPVDMGGYKIADPQQMYLPQIFHRFVWLKEDSLYRLGAHTLTLERLMNLGTFKHIKTRFSTHTGDSLLQAHFYLTPQPKRSIQLELNANSKSNNFVGSQVKLSILNRNWLKRANRIEFKLSGGFDWQVGGGQVNQANRSGYTAEAELALDLPGLIVPFFKFGTRTSHLPRTRISTGYELMSRPGLYNMNSVTLQIGYTWRQSAYLEHLLVPLSISYVRPQNITDTFAAIIRENPSLSQSFEKQFITGGNYTVTYNNKSGARTHSFYLQGNLDLAGNLAGLLAGKKADGKKYILNESFSQYLRVTGEMRHFWKIKTGITWVNRLLAGYGYSYGNSKSLPFVKQYFAGGSNSLRAFRARTLGPGSYQSPQSIFAANEAGDIRLELNSEWRLKLAGRVEAALFAESGNIWLLREDSRKPGSGVQSGNLLAEQAVGTGMGIRVDASILILRLDLAAPLRKPWLPSGERWVINQWNLGDAGWRRDNLILNIAIGYPF